MGCRRLLELRNIPQGPCYMQSVRSIVNYDRKPKAETREIMG